MNVFKVLLAAITLGLGVTAVGAFAAESGNMTQTIAGGGVTVKVTYLNPKATDHMRFQVVLDTHSVNLDTYDLKSLAVLRDETGKTYFPDKVENKGGGHHRESILSFPKLSPEAKRVELMIKDLSGVKERTFVWSLEQ